jgi:hypothetical protein
VPLSSDRREVRRSRGSELLAVVPPHKREPGRQRDLLVQVQIDPAPLLDPGEHTGSGIDETSRTLGSLLHCTRTVAEAEAGGLHALDDQAIRAGKAEGPEKQLEPARTLMTVHHHSLRAGAVRKRGEGRVGEFQDVEGVGAAFDAAGGAAGAAVELPTGPYEVVSSPPRCG